LPVEFEQRPSGVGYIRINANYDDLNLLIRLFERALKTFDDLDVPGIIIDMRQNNGGAPLGLAGFLTDQEIIIGQDEYYSERTGRFEPEGPVDKILPNQNQYRFDKIALLVGQACFSACEYESYGFSRVPGVIVVGETPTAGVYAEVCARAVCVAGRYLPANPDRSHAVARWDTAAGGGGRCADHSCAGHCGNGAF
jgi:C-terminal processing protease CtpA/Prc